MTQRRPKPEFTQPGPSGPPPIVPILTLVFALVIEALMLIMLFGAYAETMGVMSDVYLCDQPAIGRLFCVIDDEMTVSHLLALLLAIFSIAVPIAIWAQIIEQRIHEDPGAWLARPANRIYAAIALALYVLVFALESVNIYTLIAREVAGGPFASTHANPLMEFLAANQGLGIFVAVLVAVVNTVLALITVRAVHGVRDSLN